jgi:sodium pump decarboxylase gamma subunit
MNTWLQGLQVALVGVLVIFAALMLLLSIIILRKSLSNGRSVQKTASQDANQPNTQSPAYTSAIPDEVNDKAIVAAITASIYYMLCAEQEAPQGFIVRRIRRIA